MDSNLTNTRTFDRRSAPRRRPLDKDLSELSYRNALLLLLFPLVFLYYEWLSHIALYHSVSGSFFAYSALFSISAGLVCALLCSIFRNYRVNYWIMLGILILTTLYFGLQVVYFKFFSDFFYWDLLVVVGGDVTQFWSNTMKTIWTCRGWILLLMIPPVAFAVTGRRIIRPVAMRWSLRGAGALLAVLFFLAGVGFVNLHSGELEDRYYYREGFIMSEAAGRFGILTAMRLDTRYFLFGADEGGHTELTVSTGDSKNWGELFETTPSPGTSSGGSPGTSTDAPVSGQESGSSGSEGSSSPVPTAPVTTPEPPKPADTSPNVLDIDFESLIAAATKNKATALKNAHTYFSTRTPTNKNEYTGMFAGKNVIFITVEGWAPAAINQALTPTLWKMKNEGFVFENYFCSNWGGSTATGEYANITGNFFNSASCLKYSASTYQPFTLGNMLKSSGYRTYAFHNWTRTYYSRDLSHPNFGYTYYGVDGKDSAGNYKGSSGWNVTFTKAWPLSDRELALNTLSFIPTDGSPFHLYYMTVSGHAYQTWGSSMAKLHKAEILAAGLVNSAGAPYTAEYALSFIAAQYEVELMVTELCRDLEAKGLLEDTVFVLCPDHYPYQLSEDETKNTAALAQMYDLPEDGIYTNYNLYRAPLIIWSASMKEPVRVSKVCSAIDVLPTMLNLLGMKYDSRIIMGRDILSTAEGFVILNMSNAGSISSSLNWITDYGFYSSKTKTFTPFDWVTVDTAKLKASGYYSNYNTQVSNMYTYSKYILNNNYYKTLFPKGLPD